MAYIILDADGWQNVVDFKTGESLDIWDNKSVDDMLDFIPHHPYPGDMDQNSIEWTGNVGKAVFDLYDPQYMLLTYATPSFVKAAEDMSKEKEQEVNTAVFSSVKDFLEHTGYTPFILGTGGMRKIKELQIPAKLKGRISHGHGPFSYSGIFGATYDELDVVRNIEHTTMYTKDDLRRDFPEADESYYADMPDCLIVRDPGYAFTCLRHRGLFQYKSSEIIDKLPIYTTLPMPSHITDVKRVINEALDNGDKVALIVLEGIGTDDFLLPFELLPAFDKWLIYSDSFSQYMALLLGEPFYRFGIPLVREPSVFKERFNRYPYSQFTDGEMPKNTIGRRKDIKTAAVGSRSIYTHAISQADICIECHARQKISSGILILVNDPK